MCSCHLGSLDTGDPWEVMSIALVPLQSHPLAKTSVGHFTVSLSGHAGKESLFVTEESRKKIIM